MRKSSECLAEANLRLLTAPPHTSFLFLCFFLFPASRSFSCAAYVKGEASVRFKHQTALQHQRRSKGIQSHTPLTTVGQVIFKKKQPRAGCPVAAFLIKDSIHLALIILIAFFTEVVYH